MSEIVALRPTAEFLEEAARMGVEFEPGDVERLGMYLALLLEANRSFNLTAITEESEAWTKHILDSLTLLPLVSEAGDGARAADVGSGGGAPGLPLAIVLPGMRFTLIEATGKKAAFLRATAEAIGLTNVEVVSERAEVVGQDHQNHREMYDVVTARALGHLRVAAELSAPLAKIGGRALLIKGAQAEQELIDSKQALHMLHVTCSGIVATPTGRIVVLEKARATPRLYPRRAGEPKRSPLG